MMRGRTEPGLLKEGLIVVNNGDCVAIFNSIHRVMKAEQVLKEKRLEMLLIPVPRQLTADCGLAIRFPQELCGQVEQVLAAAELSWAELWLKESSEFRKL